jgi:hypothetical protein
VPATKSRAGGRFSLVVLGTLAVVSNLPPEEAEGTALERRLNAARWDGTDRPVVTLPVALSIMAFFALCASTIGESVKKDRGSPQAAPIAE